MKRTFNIFNNSKNENNIGGIGEQGLPLTRYWVIGIVLLIACSLILFHTARIQLSGKEWSNVELTKGQGSAMVLEAPRGDIVDRNGISLAYSEFTDSLYLSYTALGADELNKMLLDLAETLAEHGVKPISQLTKYIDLASADKDKAEGEERRYVFKRDPDIIRAWQQNRDLFNLASEKSKDANRPMVMMDPNEFVRHMLFETFAIENKEDKGNLIYTQDEAWTIMQMRYQLMENNWTFKQGEPVLIAENIPESLKAIIREQNERFQGALIKRVSRRRYSDDARYFSHILGYVGAISAEEYDYLKDFSYGLNDVIGKAGVEYSAERYLHGKNGRMPYGSWVNDQGREVYEEGSGGVAPQPGATVRLTQDVKMQKVLYASLYDAVENVRETGLGKGKSAAAVMLDLKTGQILAMGSIPSFSSNDFISSAYDKEAEKRVVEDLSDKDRKPMQNRCISEIYAPASTFKPVTAAAAIMEKVIDEKNNRYPCRGKDKIGFKNWVCFGEPDVGHGMISLDEAMMYSCNLYFFQLSLDTGIDALSGMAEKLGLGEYSGIDLPGEAKGIRPNPILKKETRLSREDQEWYPADTCQTSIGQFDNAYTILQMVRAVGGLASNRLQTPHVIYDIRSVDGQQIKAEQISSREVGLSEKALEMVRSSMDTLRYYSASNNTYSNFSDYPIPVAAKTGTGEVGFGEMTINALFVGFAPSDDPEVAVACIVEEGGRGDITSNIARDLLDAWYGYEMRPELLERLEALEADPSPFFENAGYVSGKDNNEAEDGQDLEQEQEEEQDLVEELAPEVEEENIVDENTNDNVEEIPQDVEQDVIEGEEYEVDEGIEES